MDDTQATRRLLRSINHALWMIVAILLILLGVQLNGMKLFSLAQMIMVLGFWGGFLLFLCVLARLVTGRFAKPEDR